MKNCKNTSIVSMILILVPLLLNACTQIIIDVDYTSETIMERFVSEIEADKAEILSQEKDETLAALPSETFVYERSPDFFIWTGIWNGLDVYLDDPGLLETYQIMSEIEGNTAEDIRSKLENQYQSENISMEIEGDTITVYEQKQMDGMTGDLTSKITYTYLKDIAQTVYRKPANWYIFQAEGETNYPFLLFRGVNEGKFGTSLSYFKFLRSADIENYSWSETEWIQMFPATTDISSVAAHIINHGRPIIFNWSGDWNNLLYNLDKECWEEIYKVLAEEKGCTTEEIMAILKEEYYSDVVAMGNRHNILGFEGRTYTMQSEWVNYSFAEIVYAYVGSETTEWGTWYIFEAESWEINVNYRKNAKVYPVMLLSKVEEDTENTENCHYHYRYGNNAEDLLAMEGWLPTMVNPWYSYQEVIELLKSHDRSAN